jgi:hypothetical protein
MSSPAISHPVMKPNHSGFRLVLHMDIFFLMYDLFRIWSSLWNAKIIQNWHIRFLPELAIFQNLDSMQNSKG